MFGLIVLGTFAVMTALSLFFISRAIRARRLWRRILYFGLAVAVFSELLLHSVSEYYALNIAVDIDEVHAANLVKSYGLKPRIEVLLIPDSTVVPNINADLIGCSSKCREVLSSGKVAKFQARVYKRNEFGLPEGQYLIDMPGSACNPEEAFCVTNHGRIYRFEATDKSIDWKSSRTTHDCQDKMALIYSYRECDVLLRNNYDDGFLLYEKVVYFPSSFTFPVLQSPPSGIPRSSTEAMVNWITGETKSLDYDRFAQAFLGSHE